MKKAITILTAIVMCVSMSAKMMVYSANDVEFYLKIVSASAGTISNDGATITFASAAEAKGAKLVVQEFIKADASNPSIQQIGSTFSVSDKAITLGHGVSYSVPIGEMKEYTLNGNTISTDCFVSCFDYANKRKQYGSGTGEATWGHSTDFQWAYDRVDQLSIIWGSSFDDPNYDNSTETAHFQGNASDEFPFTQFEATIGDVETGTYTIDIIDTWEHAELGTQNGTFINVDGKNKVLITNHSGIQIVVGSDNNPAVASVTTEGGETTEYATVEEAFEAVQNHDVLKLLADYNVPVDLENEKNGILGVENIYEQVYLTLDLNGHTLGFPDGGYLNVGTLTDMTVSGGTISGTANCIYNTGVLRLGNCTITATEGVGIAGNGELELHTLPTFNCENEDIALEQDKLIYFVPGSYAVPEKKIKVSIKNTPPYLFTHQFDLCLTSNPEDVFVSTQYGDHAVGYCFFEGTYEAGIAGLTEITFPAGKSTYFDERALALYEANDKLKFYTVTDVDETNASVEVTEFDGKLFGQNAALIVSNETGAPVTAKFIEAFDGPMANYYTNLALDDLNGKYTYFGFEGTNVDLEEATDYEKQDPEKNYFYPIPGLTYYGFNGTGFVRLSRLGPIAAHRCWLGLGTPEVLGARSLTVNWPNGAPTGISDKGIVNSERFAAAEGWYGIDGRKLDSEPVGKGIYIRRNGNKAEKLIIK